MNREQLETYIQKYGRDIYSFCIYLTRNKEDADDLYQQAFLIAMQKNEMDEKQNPKAYIISLASNIWKNHKRKYLWRKKKVVILMYYMEELTVDEIANALAIPPGTVKSRLHQAKAKLRERLESYNEG